MRFICQLLIFLLSACFEVSAQNGAFTFYDFILDGKHISFKEKRFSPLSNYLFVSDSLYNVGNENFNEVKFPDEGELVLRRLKSYFQFDGNNFYYFSDLLVHSKRDKQLLFQLSPRNGKNWKLKSFFSNGLTNFELRLVESAYDSILKDTIYSFKVYDFNYTVSHMPYTFVGFEFCRSKKFLKFEYNWLGKELLLVQSDKKRRARKAK